MATNDGDHMPALLQRLQDPAADGAASRRLLEQAIRDHPADPRVYLLLAAERMHAKEVDAAEGAYIAALQLAPAFHIARFQLGLLQLTSGRPSAAIATWAPLEMLDEGEPLRLFKQGLECMARDDFDGTRRLLKEGMARNTANPPLNRDMQLVIDTIAHLGSGVDPTEGGKQPASAHFLVSSYAKAP